MYHNWFYKLNESERVDLESLTFDLIESWNCWQRAVCDTVHSFIWNCFVFVLVLDRVLEDERSKTFQGIRLDMSLDYDVWQHSSFTSHHDLQNDSLQPFIHAT